MARTDYGNNLATPVLKPGTTRFVVTQAGFDTGQRTFQVDETALERALPQLDSADTDIIFASHTGTVRGSYRTMYVAGISDIVELTNGIREFTVSYQGLIQWSKRPYEAVQTSVTTFVGQIQGDTKPGFYNSTPIVTVTKVQNTKPDPEDLGTIIVPPGWEAIQKRVTIKGVVYPLPSFANWILKERDYRRCGPLFENREQYVYEIIGAET